MPAEDTDTRAWQVYGQRQLARASTPPVPERLGWTPWEGNGPGAEVLGDVTGRRVLPDQGALASPGHRESVIPPCVPRDPGESSRKPHLRRSAPVAQRMEQASS